MWCDRQLQRTFNHVQGISISIRCDLPHRRPAVQFRNRPLRSNPNNTCPGFAALGRENQQIKCHVAGWHTYLMDWFFPDFSCTISRALRMAHYIYITMSTRCRTHTQTMRTLGGAAECSGHKAVPYGSIHNSRECVRLLGNTTQTSGCARVGTHITCQL